MLVLLGQRTNYFFFVVLPSNETSRTAAKRPQQRLLEDEDNWFKTKSVVEIMLCEAEALTQLQKPLEAYECYERFVRSNCLLVKLFKV